MDTFEITRVGGTSELSRNPRIWRWRIEPPVYKIDLKGHGYEPEIVADGKK